MKKISSLFLFLESKLTKVTFVRKVKFVKKVSFVHNLSLSHVLKCCSMATGKSKTEKKRPSLPPVKFGKENKGISNLRKKGLLLILRHALTN